MMGDFLLGLRPASQPAPCEAFLAMKVICPKKSPERRHNTCQTGDQGHLHSPSPSLGNPKRIDPATKPDFIQV